MPCNSDIWRYYFLLNYLYSLEEETRREYWGKNTRSKAFFKRMKKSFKRSLARDFRQTLVEDSERAFKRTSRKFRPMMSSSDPTLHSKRDDDVRRLLRQDSRKRGKRADSLPRQSVPLSMEGCGPNKADCELQRIRLVKELSNRQAVQVPQHPIQLYPVSSTKRRPMDTMVNCNEYIPPAVPGKESKCSTKKCQATCSGRDPKYCYENRRFPGKVVNRRSTAISQTDNNLPPDDPEVEVKTICLQQDCKTPCDKVAPDGCPGLIISGVSKTISVRVSVTKKSLPEQQLKACEPLLKSVAEQPARSVTEQPVTEPPVTERPGGSFTEQPTKSSTQDKGTISKCELYNCEARNKQTKPNPEPEEVNDIEEPKEVCNGYIKPPEETAEPVKDSDFECAANSLTEPIEQRQEKILPKENKETLIEERRKSDDTNVQTSYNDFSVRNSRKSNATSKLECPTVCVDVEQSMTKCGANEPKLESLETCHRITCLPPSMINVKEQTGEDRILKKESKDQISIATQKSDDKTCPARNKKCQVQAKSKSTIQIMVDTDSDIKTSALPMITEEPAPVMGCLAPAPKKVEMAPNEDDCYCPVVDQKNVDLELVQDSAATVTEDLSKGQTSSQIDMQQNYILMKYKMELSLLQSEYDERKKMLQAMHNKKLELLDLKKKMIMKKLQGCNNNNNY